MRSAFKVLIMSILLSLTFTCRSNKTGKEPIEVPIKNIIFSLPFPTDLVYQSSPDSRIIIGRKRIKPGIFEISAFAVDTGHKRWELPFRGELVGQTATHSLVYEAGISTVHFINPKDGKITQTVSPAPNPLTSQSGHYLGMAFTDELYITTNSLYTTVIDNGEIDESFPIGITAKTWENNEQQWFVPPVKQILDLKYKPIIKNDKLLIINFLQKINSGHSYQIVDLKTGQEHSKTTTEGEFKYLGEKCFIEQTNDFLRCFEPFSGKEFWRISGAFKNAQINALGSQISVQYGFRSSQSSVLIIEANTGETLKKNDLRICYCTGRKPQ
jgi:hypothetical protein